MYLGCSVYKSQLFWKHNAGAVVRRKNEDGVVVESFLLKLIHDFSSDPVVLMTKSP